MHYNPVSYFPSPTKVKHYVIIFLLLKYGHPIRLNSKYIIKNKFKHAQSYRCAHALQISVKLFSTW